ncbi:FAD-binding protein [Cylindrospermopsis raciborskii]|uniref:FAD-dependent oxidoreductase n=1 Tax=Cylindrospermopsis raciborskii TaxID=77022 RepID=UPI0001C16677|nr:FAD-binding protein [Cylindrospermopsis raciborskii]EFA72194.1 Glucose-inhibited division protein A [Raphidiopsis brookii D9]MCZ2201300.1 FAD-binding protein [Cylindrospermopsis raciborskii PAMP2012]MCZ2206225.1 FAD-binding protein [Cylindrospermopsis raciborskii PAMP2011]
MTQEKFSFSVSSKKNSHETLVADVLVIGGGPAGAWAAWSAANAGAKVVLVDKGYCGTSGCAAAAGNGVWYVPPEPESREAAMASRESLGGFLSLRDWMERVLDQTYTNVNQLADWGYPFPTDEEGKSYRRSLQGPEYMRLMRKKVKQAGVKILDHSPALQLLVDKEGAVAGSRGINRQTGENWIVRSHAVVIATGGCAFLSKALGCNVLTGDGYLMAAEMGAEMSGMEFSNAYAIAPAFSSVTKTLFYNWASFTYEDGTLIPGAGSQKGRSVIAQTLLTQPVYAIIDKASEQMRSTMRLSQPNFFLPFDRLGIDPFTQRFPVTLRLEGTVRGTGGIRITDYTCATSVPGLYAAGDAATRELICGGFTGGGSHNAAWALSSGYWAGKFAAKYSQDMGIAANERYVEFLEGAGLTSGSSNQVESEEIVKATQAEVFPYNRNYFRNEEGLTTSLGKLDSLWKAIRQGEVASNNNLLRTREAAAMVATARWMYSSALERRETRGMHRRQDYPELDAAQQHHLISGGLDQVWVKSITIPMRTHLDKTSL